MFSCNYKSETKNKRSKDGLCAKESAWLCSNFGQQKVEHCWKHLSTFKNFRCSIEQSEPQCFLCVRRTRRSQSFLMKSKLLASCVRQKICERSGRRGWAVNTNNSLTMLQIHIAHLSEVYSYFQKHMNYQKQPLKDYVEEQKSFSPKHFINIASQYRATECDLATSTLKSNYQSLLMSKNYYYSDLAFCQKMFLSFEKTNLTN